MDALYPIVLLTCPTLFNDPSHEWLPALCDMYPAPYLYSYHAYFDIRYQIFICNIRSHNRRQHLACCVIDMESPEASPVIPPSLPQRPRRPTRDLPARPDVVLVSPIVNGIAPKAVPPPKRVSSDDSKPFENDIKASKEPSEVDRSPTDVTTLTPLRAHYLKKALLALQFNRELTYVSSSPLPPPISVLSLLGPPFTSLPRSALERGGIQDVPFLRFMFRQFVLTFPFLATAPKDFFPSKLQPFVDSLLSRNLSSELTLFPEEDPDVDSEQKGTAKALAKFEKHMALLLSSAIKLIEDEEVVRLSQKDLDRLEGGMRRRERRQNRSKSGRFNVNVICVRSISEKGRMRRRHHEVCCMFDLSLRALC